jgi:hypothetical protein
MVSSVNAGGIKADGVKKSRIVGRFVVKKSGVVNTKRMFLAAEKFVSLQNFTLFFIHFSMLIYLKKNFKRSLIFFYLSLLYIVNIIFHFYSKNYLYF